MSRRGENIYKRKDGRYEGRYIKGRRENGKPLFGYIYAKTYSKVKAELAIAKAETGNKSASFIIGQGTLAEFMQYWLEESVKERVKASTYTRYYERVATHIIPALGKQKIRKLTVENIQKFADSLINKNLAVSTTGGIIGVLRMALKKACELGAVEKNPCDKLKLPEHTVKKARALDRKQQIIIEKAAQKAAPHVELAVFLSLYTGMRIGELCALRWRDIDFESGTLTVNGTIQRIKNLENSSSKTTLIESAPKSKKSYRTIPLQSELKELLLRRREDESSDGYVLSSDGKRLEPRILRARFSRLVQKEGIDINFHTLRHTFATRCLEFNFDIQTISELLGHSNASVTMQVYAHSVLEHKRQLVNRMQILS